MTKFQPGDQASHPAFNDVLTVIAVGEDDGDELVLHRNNRNGVRTFSLAKHMKKLDSRFVVGEKLCLATSATPEYVVRFVDEWGAYLRLLPLAGEEESRQAIAHENRKYFTSLSHGADESSS